MSEFKNLLKESLIELSNYIGRAKPEIEEMADYFYSGVEEKGLEKIPLLLEGLQWIAEVLGHAADFQSDDFPMELLSRSLTQELKSLEEALGYRDWVMFADLLQYQLIPLLDQISETSTKAEKIL